ncbi:MAG: pyridoxal phosphate-dependent decarboxylase family protein [Bacillota bacterium]
MQSNTGLELTPDTICRLAHRAAEIIADYLTQVPNGPAIRPTTLRDVEQRVGGPMPVDPGDPFSVLDQIAAEIAPFGVHNAHPRFWGYVGTSASISASLADGIAAALNLNVVTSKSRPTAVQVELTALGWLKQLLGLSPEAGALLTSGGTMANLLGLAAARQARAPGQVRKEGMQALPARMTLYASTEAHICHQKIAEVMGFGSQYLRRIPVDGASRMDMALLRAAVAADRAAGLFPLAVIGSAGTTNHGAVDPLADLADFCSAEGIWLHVDACYGGFALTAAADENGDPVLSEVTLHHLRAMSRADSVAADPHKSLYIPVEAGVVFVRDPQHLWEAFHLSAEYLVGGDHNFHEYGLATSRAFRALKIWTALRHHGSRALAGALAGNMRLTRYMRQLVTAAPDLEPVGPEPELSILCYRYVPADLRARLARGSAPECEAITAYVDRLNDRLVADLQAGGEAYVSSTVLAGRPVIRACILNYRSTRADVEAFVALTQSIGAAVDRALGAERP